MQSITFTISMGANNLEYTKLLLHSLKTNLDNKTHQIIVFIDADNENSLDYLVEQQKEFHDLCIINNTLSMPIGYQRNKTLLTEYAKHDIVSHLHSDMVIGPHYDTDILKHMKRGRFLSAMRVEPPLHGESNVTITKNFGLHPDEFDMEAWNKFSNSVKREELVEYFFAPYTYYKDDWMMLDGDDTAFRRAREDSDLVQRCVHAGIELLYTFSANVYHFTCVSSRGNNWFDPNNTEAQKRVNLQKVADSIEMRKFIRKWGNFNHGETKLFKLDIDLVVKNYNLQTVYNLEPFFTTVWVDSQEHKNNLLEQYNKEHLVANELLRVTDEDWENYKHLFRVDNFEEIFKVGTPTEYNIKVIIDFNKISNTNTFISNLQNLYDMLIDSDVGEYELDGVMISIKNIKVLPTEITAVNPKFNHDLLTVYN